jgi:uncharacterized membrane protein YfcA
MAAHALHSSLIAAVNAAIVGIAAATKKGDRTVSKLSILVPLAFIAIAIYLFALAWGPAETVELVPGHDVPDRFVVMLGAIAIVAAIAVTAEAFRASRNPQASRSRRG